MVGVLKAVHCSVFYKLARYNSQTFTYRFCAAVMASIVAVYKPRLLCTLLGMYAVCAALTEEHIALSSAKPEIVCARLLL